MKSARHHQHIENSKAVSVMVSHLKPIWEKYPRLVLGAACTFCSSNHNIVEKLITPAVATDKNLMLDIGLDPTYFSDMYIKGLLSKDTLQELSTLHAYLSSAGDQRTGAAVGQLLAQEKQWDELLLWTKKGMNGGRSLTSLQLDKIPLNIVISAWENGVNGGYDKFELTEFLILNGHRPALRWIIWVEGTDFQYLRNHDYKRQSQRYKNLLKLAINFPVMENNRLAEFYSNNWRNISWRHSTKKWTYTAQ